MYMTCIMTMAKILKVSIARRCILTEESMPVHYFEQISMSKPSMDIGLNLTIFTQNIDLVYCHITVTDKNMFKINTVRLSLN